MACRIPTVHILLANYDDKTLLRDWAASALANAIPIDGNYLSEVATAGTTPPSPSGTSTVMPWASHSVFVELFLNGEYEGNYQLIEQIKFDSHRVNLTELAETDTTDDVSGGFLVEIDHRQDQAFIWTSPQGIKMGLDDPDFTPDPEVPEQTDYISNYVNQAETALFSSNFTDPSTGWRNYFDEAAAINFYIDVDVMGNADGGQFYSSDYFYKAKDNQYLYMGPIWDFDISSGNVYYNSIFNPTVPWMQKNAKWYVQWFKDPGFKVDVVKQWNQLKADGIFTTWLGSINAQAAALELSQANNFGRWPMLGVKVWPNPQVAGSYDGEVAYLTNWLRTRIAYLDAQLNGKTVSTTTLTLPGGTLRAGMPVALTSKTIASGTPSGTVTFLSNGLVVGTATISGGTASGSYNLPAGTDSLTAVYNGDTTFGLSASSAQSVTVLAPLVESATNLSTSVSQSDSGASVSFAISVLATSGTTVPSGNVAINVNGNAFGNVSLTGGSATFVTTSLPLGANTIQAIYGGDTYFAGSTSPTLTVAVSRPTCSSPTSAGVAACSPTNNSTVTSPVRVQAASTVTGKLARMEVWVDGVKKYSETTSNILNTSLTLAAGKHRFDFCAVNTTGTKWETTVSSTVSSGLIAPTITWPNPASITSGTPLSATQLDATANVAGTFAYNPAAGTVLAVGTQTLSTTFTPTDTTHYGTATKSVSITVTGGTGCNAPTAAGVAVCSPINNSTAASPVKTQAAATITGTLSRMEVWVDGVKKYSETTSKLLNTSLTLAAGKHRFDFYAVNTSGAKWETSVYSTIQ